MQFKQSGQECEVVPKCSMDKTPERGVTRPRVRGRRETRCHTASSRGMLEQSLVKCYSTRIHHPDSLKWERMPSPQAVGPMQSSAQKNTKLKLVVMVPPQVAQQAVDR